MSSLTSEYRYAVGIPTKDRENVLLDCLNKFFQQTIKPSLIVIANNNSNGKDVVIPKDAPCPISVVPNLHPVKGISQGNAVALKKIIEEGFEIAVKWDDDLFPEPNCMEKLIRWMGEFNVVGGCYPQPGSLVWKGGPLSNMAPPDGNKNHIQFFKWFGENDSIPSPMVSNCLYSSYMYRVSSMMDVGGFVLEHSPIGYREDTDLTSRMGKCLIDPEAIAIHLACGGGNRGFRPNIRETMMEHDGIIFINHMKKYKINIGSLWKLKEHKE